ncbi:substrate-binding domain-containing protein [Carboxylicivirga sp. N1Y90]|uniref:substrate-binding domain-containing protein n=1 Tax=Carboxylicivirga fragile TaxID=3417571 RepID=UPI003D355B1A|nr:substrate-binding domain-containing protein [Marinilabiliaceae bacterium N1Y90]
MSCTKNRLIKNCEPNLFIAANNDLIGQHMTREVLKKTQTGNVVILAGDKYDRNAVELQDAIDKEIAPLVESGQLKVLYKTFIEEWSDHNATYEFEQFLSLSGEKPDIVFAGYDGIAESVIHMLERNNLMENVYITGQDAELRAIKNIIDGKQVMTVFHPLKEIAYQVAELAVNLGNDKMPEKSELSYINNGLIDVPTIKMNSKAVTIENIDEVLIKSGTYTKEEVYN